MFRAQNAERFMEGYVMSKLTRAMIVIAVAAFAIGIVYAPASANSIMAGDEVQKAMLSGEGTQSIIRLPKRPIHNATMFSFKGQCSKRSDCGAGTWSCCNTSCEPVAKCK